MAEKSSKNILMLIEKVLLLLLGLKSDTLKMKIKQELMEQNAVLKKNYYKANNKTISNILNKKFGVSRE